MLLKYNHDNHKSNVGTMADHEAINSFCTCLGSFAKAPAMPHNVQDNAMSQYH